MLLTNKKTINQLISAVMLFGIQYSTQASTVEKQENFSGVETVKIKTIAGDLRLGRSTSGEVEVHVLSTYDENKMSMKMEQEGNLLNLSEISHSNSSSNGNSIWTVGIPDGLDIKVKFSTASGDIVASDLTGNLKVNTASGDIELRNFTGTAKGNTASGDIKLENTNGPMDLNTASGDVTANIVEGKLILNTASGNINITTVTLNEKSSFNSASGDVEVSVIQTPMHNLKLSSASGNVILNMQGNELQGHIRMTTKIGFLNKISAPFDFDKEEEYERNGDQYITKSVILGDPQMKITLSTSSGDAIIND